MTKTILKTLALAMVFGGLAFTAQAGNTKFVNIGTAGIGGGYYPAGGALCNMINKTRKEMGHNLRCTVEATGGSVSNLRSIAAGDLEMSFSQSDWQYHAYHGSSKFKDAGPNKDLRFMFSLQFDAFHFVVNPKLNVKSMQDLKGKVVNTGNVGSGHASTLKMLFKDYYNIDPGSFFAKEARLTSREQAQALCDGKIDAFLFPCALGSSSPTEAAATCKAKMVPWRDTSIQKLIKERPYFGANDIPAGTYEAQDQEVPSWGVLATVVTTTRMSEDDIYNITKSIFDNWDVFQKQSRVFVGVSREGAAHNGQSAPYHPGALKYFKEVGLVK